MTRPFLQMVQYDDVAPNIQDSFNEWYAVHAYHVSTIPGYVSACRYVSILGEPRYAALYQIATEQGLELANTQDLAKRHPSLASDIQRKRDMLPNPVPMAVFGGIYESLLGYPAWEHILASNNPLSLVRSDIRDEDEVAFNHWYDLEHVPALLKVPGYVAAARFKRSQHPVVSHQASRSPRYLAMYQIKHESFIPQIGIPEKLGPEAKAERERAAPWIARMTHLSRAYYRPIARFWPILPSEGRQTG